MQFAKIGSVTLHYQLIGAPAGKPVIVFANSLGTDFRIWRDVIVRLAGDFAIVTYDMRGHGLSDLGGQTTTMDDHVADLAGLLDLLDTRQVIVCGLSVGGLVAQGLYAARPDLVRALKSSKIRPSRTAPRTRSAPTRAGMRASTRYVPTASSRLPVPSWSAGSRRPFAPRAMPPSPAIATC